MKINNKYKFLLFLLLSAGLYSCEKMTDIYKDFVKDGETTYLVKPDSVESFAGNSRVLLKCRLHNAYNVDKIWVYWNNRSDSAVFNYTMKNIDDTVEMMIEGLEEKAYIFDLYTKNINGDRSVKVGTSGTSYGEKYKATLYPRTIKKIVIDTVNATFDWSPSDETEASSEVKFTDTDGITHVVYHHADSLKTLLPKFDDNKDITFRSFYLPEATAIDSFPTEWKKYQMPPCYDLYKSLKVTPITGGVRIEWDNPLSIVVTVKVQYLNNNDVLTTKVFKVSPGTISGLNTNPREFKITVNDQDYNTFGPKLFRATPL